MGGLDICVRPSGLGQKAWEGLNRPVLKAWQACILVHMQVTLEAWQASSLCFPGELPIEFWVVANIMKSHLGPTIV